MFNTEITRVQVSLNYDRESNIKGEATVVFNDCLVVHSIRIKDVNGSLFVCMPINTHKRGKRNVNGRKVPWDAVHPTTKEFNDYLTSAVLREYYKELNKSYEEDYVKVANQE